MSTLRFMSHNQWKCDQNQPKWAEKGLDCSAAVRERGFVKLYGEILPDVVGLQEVSGLMIEYLMQGLKEEGLNYSLLWGKDTPVLFRRDKLELVDSDFCLYPEKVPGYEGCFNNSRTKSYTVAVFRTKDTGKFLIFTSTHLWWKNGNNPALNYYQPYSDEARVYQIGLAIDAIRSFQKIYRCPAILVGDMNGDFHSPAIRFALQSGFRHGHDMATEYKNEENGYHWCGNDGYVPYNPGPFETGIDHILIADADPTSVRRFDRYTPDYYLPLSDHSPVWIDMEL